MSDDKTLMSLARSVANGEPVDWSAVERDARGDEIAVVRELHHLESILAAHREALAGDGDGKSQDRVPWSWGPLEVLEKIGEGSFGEVFRARDPRLGREVALKLRRAPEPGMPYGEAGVIEEGRLLSGVRHPGVAIIHGADRHGGRVGLWMELVRGRTLEALLRDHGVFGAREAGTIGVELCQSLAAVHRAGLIHGDVKARNVMREEGGRIVLMDFGAGTTLGMLDAEDPAVSGTPLYMAPEILRGERSTVQSDVYSLGVLLFHMVTDTYPVRAASLRELREAQARGNFQILGELRPDLPPPFVRIVERAMAVSPQDRFASAAAMGQALAAALGIESGPQHGDGGAEQGERSWGRTRRLLLGIAAAVLLPAAVIGWIAWRGRPDPPSTTPDHPAAAALPDPQGGVGSALLAPGAPGAVPADYTVEASFHQGVAERRRLAQGDVVKVGDALSMEFRASRALHVYVVNEDEKGTAVLLFPLAGGEETNPLVPDRTHHLPGALDGATRYWQVTSAGGREHFLIVASPDPVEEIAREALSMERPRPGEPLLYPKLSEETKLRLRGVTGMITAPGPRLSGATARLFDRAERLEGGTPETASGVWVRRLDLENPGH